MSFARIFFVLTYLVLVDALVIKNVDDIDINEETTSDIYNISNKENENPINVFNGVYTDCLFGMSFVCLQKKTLLYLKELNKLNEVSVLGDYLKFVRLNTSENPHSEEEMITGESSEELSSRIDKAVDKFFDNHLIRFSALGKDLLVPRKVEEFVGRKRRKGGGGGGGGHGGGDGGKKKMMMMAMMCMKMKLMMMVPAMMGMMGMMSFKGMMFSMMSFLISKMMLLMKILEKKGGGGGGGGGDGGWAAGGGGGGAWMPAGQDYGGGGGYDANGQWQSRSIIEDTKDVQYNNKGSPIISYVKPNVRFNNNVNDVKPLTLLKSINDEIVKVDHEASLKSRKKRGIMDVLQNAYLYWTHKVLGTGHKKYFNYPKYKIINGVKYVYSPMRNVLKLKTPKELKANVLKNTNEQTNTIVTIDNYNKGEIIEGVAEGRMNRRKFHKLKENVSETMDENPWQ